MQTEKDEHFIFVLSDVRETANHIVEAIFSDLRKNPDVDVQNGLYTLPKNTLLKFLMHIHTAKKINDFLPMPFISIWNRFLQLSQYQFNPDKKYYIVLQNNALSKAFDFNFFRKLSQMPNIELVYFTFDPLSLPWSHIEKVNKIGISKRLTYSKADSEKYSMTLVSTPYSTLFPELTNPENQNVTMDACFVGIATDSRLEFLSQLFKKLGSEKQCIYFNLSKDRRTIFGKRKLVKEVLTNDVLKWNTPGEILYTDALKKAISSNVIVEISAQKDHTAPTLRYYEAVVYNKKLLTNIADVKNYPFYNPKYMRIFNSIHDIDEETIRWMKTRERVNYSYSGEFSPSNLCAIISS